MRSKYELYYWPMTPGRGEFIRLILEYAGADYTDVGRLSEDLGGGIAGVQQFLNRDPAARGSFAMPLLRDGDLVISQLPNIALYLGDRLGLLPSGDDRWIANQLQLSIADVINECHDTHHPLSTSLHYEDQKKAAKKKARYFLKERLPRWLEYFERSLSDNGGEVLCGKELSAVDIQLFQLMRGITHAFPNHHAALGRSTPLTSALVERIGNEKAIRQYLASDRYLNFNEFGIFRHYPELESLS